MCSNKKYSANSHTLGLSITPVDKKLQSLGSSCMHADHCLFF